jgi:hypothetical protein
MPVIISAAVRDTGVITSRSPLVFSLGFQSVSSGPFTLSTLALPVSLQQKMPAFPTVNRLTTSRTPVFISMPNYENLLEYVEQNTNVTAESLTGVSVPKELLLIRVSDQSSPLQVEALVNSLNSLLNDQDFTVTNLREQIASTQSAAALITDVFLIGQSFI